MNFMKNRVFLAIGWILILFGLLALSPLALRAAPQNVQKDGGALTAGFTVPSGVSISATGTGTIAATTVTGFSPVSGKVLTLSNSMTLTATDGSTVAFGAGGTVAYTASTVASIAGTTNQISASASTGAVTLSLAGPHAFTTLTSTALLLGAGTSPISASDMTYSTPTLSVPDAFVVSSAGSIGLTAGGSNKSVTITPSGTGGLGIGTSGTTTGPRVLVFSRSATTTPTFSTGNFGSDNDGLGIYTEAGSGMTIFTATASSRAVINMRRSRGTLGTPTAVQDGDALMTIGSSGYEGTGNWGGGALDATVDGTVSTGIVPTKLVLSATSILGVRNQQAELKPNGSFQVGIANVSSAAWGTTGVNFVSLARTITNTTSSGTVATAVANSFAAPTFAASSSTTFTNAANLYIAGDVAAGTNVTLTNSYGLWNVGKTRLDGAVHIPASNTTGIQFYNNATIGTNNELGNINFASNRFVMSTSTSGGTLRVLQLLVTGIANQFIRTGFSSSGLFQFESLASDGTQGFVGYRFNGITSTATAGTNSVLKLEYTLNQAASTAANNGIHIAVSETSLGSGQQNLIAAYAGATGTTEKFRVTNAGAIVAASTITTLGGATFHTTSSALTDGAGVALGTLATAPTAGNPTKWIGVNDNGTTRYVPAW